MTTERCFLHDHVACRCGSLGHAPVLLTPLSRRTALASGLVSLAGAAMPGLAAAQTKMTPDDAVAELVAGNARYVGRKMTLPDQDFASIRQNRAQKQEPFAAVLSCADSRVPVEIVFDQGIGRLFVTRVAGNIAAPDIIASLEYAAAYVRVPAILVMGHSNCGAVHAAVAGKAVSGQISGLCPYLRQAVEQGGHDEDAVAKDNAQNQARILAESSPVIQDLVSKRAIKVVAGYYDVASGKVAIL